MVGYNLAGDGKSLTSVTKPVQCTGNLPASDWAEVKYPYLCPVFLLKKCVWAAGSPSVLSFYRAASVEHEG